MILHSRKQYYEIITIKGRLFQILYYQLNCQSKVMKVDVNLFRNICFRLCDINHNLEFPPYGGISCNVFIHIHN